MSGDPRDNRIPDTLFTSAEWYKRSINWVARLNREIPVLLDVFGPPGEGGILDAGCGTGHQARTLAERGYRVAAADASEEMLDLARQSFGRTPLPSPLDKRGKSEVKGRAKTGSAPNVAGGRDVTPSTPIEFVHSTYATLHEKIGGGFDGLYCIGNSLAAAGTADEVKQGLQQFAKCLRPGGRLFIQILNFPIMRSDTPCVRGPRVTNVDGTEYVSVRHFVFRGDFVEVNNITLWKDDGWQFRTHAGRLYPITPQELSEWCQQFGLCVDDLWGSYAREPFDVNRSTDLILVGTCGS